MSKHVPSKLISLFIKMWNEDNAGWMTVSKDTINDGWCYQVAVLLKRFNSDNEVKLCSDHGHAWVKIGDKYYDSATPNGTKSIKKLACDRWGDLRIDIPEEELIDQWKHSNTGVVQTHLIDKVIAAYRVPPHTTNQWWWARLFK
jgi:hypothetical protein